MLRHVKALRPFRPGEFGTGPEAPSAGHLEAANQLIAGLRSDLQRRAALVVRAATVAQRDPAPANLRRLVALNEQAHSATRAVEQVWDFYLEFFGQRQSRFGPWLQGCDRIALDCYRTTYTRLGRPRPVPAPPPMTYLRTGFSPATFRRGVPVSRLGRRANPFPYVELPYHRMVNPWTLGAVLHEVSHNLQNDLGLERAVPLSIARRLDRAGAPPEVVRTWVRWNRETYADLHGLLLGGPGVVGSLIDVLARSPQTVMTFNSQGVHPTPWLRTLLSVQLLRRLGFAAEADRYEKLWRSTYEGVRPAIPAPLLRTFDRACPLVVDAVCFTAYPSLGDKALAEVVPFTATHQAMVEEAGSRLASGDDPGIVPERFLIGAVRHAFERRLASPDKLTTAFYGELARR